MKRRDFLGTGALMAGYLFLWGCSDLAREVRDEFADESSVERGEDILVIGAGMAGLAAAKELQAQSYNVTVLEGRNRIGGRIWTERSWPDAHLDMGASWIHGIEDNPITNLAREFEVETLPTDYDSLYLYNTDGRLMGDDEMEAVGERLFDLLEYIEEEAEELEEDISLGEAIEYILNEVSLTPQERRELDYAINAAIEQDMAADVSELSLFHLGEDDEFDGIDVLFPGGYDQIIQNLASGLEIKLNHIVKRIAYDETSVTVTTNQGEFKADRAVVSLPLGILRQGSVEFSPPLPSRKVTAIDNLRMGVLNKAYLRFEERFWPEDRDFLGYIPQRKGEWAVYLNLYKYIELPILLAFNGGAFGRSMEQLSDAEIVDGAMATLRQVYGQSIPDPTAWLITRWASDPFASGSYSFIPLGASGEDYDAMTEPVGARLFFAGEATNRQFPATVHGAFLSGVREARRIADL